MQSAAHFLLRNLHAPQGEPEEAEPEPFPDDEEEEEAMVVMITTMNEAS